MDAEYIERLKGAGVDTEAAVRRFSGNSAMFEKFLRKFPTDDSFAQIEPALESRDYETAVRAAHTLKGVAGTLSLQDLYESSSALVTALRQNQYDEAGSLYQRVQRDYQTVCEAITWEERV